MRVFAKKHKETQQPKSSIPNRTNALISHDVNLAPVQPKSSSPVTVSSWDFSRTPILAPVQQRSSPQTIQRQPAPTDPFGPGGVYEQLQILRGSGTLEPHEYESIPRTKDDIDAWTFEVRIKRAKKFSGALERLGELKDQRAVPLLIDIVEDKIIGPNDFTDKQVLTLKEETIATLAKIGGSVALWKLHELLNSTDPQQRMIAARAYSEASGRVAVADLRIALMQETDEALKVQIIRSLGNVGSGLDDKTKQKIVPELISVMENNVGELNRAAIIALGKIAHKTATEPLIEQLKAHHGIPPLASEIERALGNIGDIRAVDILVIMLKNNGSPVVRSAAAKALGKIGGSKALDAMKKHLSQETDIVVRAVIRQAFAGVPILHWDFKSDESPSGRVPQQ